MKFIAFLKSNSKILMICFVIGPILGAGVFVEWYNRLEHNETSTFVLIWIAIGMAISFSVALACVWLFLDALIGKNNK